MLRFWSYFYIVEFWFHITWQNGPKTRHTSSTTLIRWNFDRSTHSPRVNFINDIHTNFSYERRVSADFSSYMYVEKWCLYKKFVRKMLMKLTPRDNFTNIYSPKFFASVFLLEFFARYFLCRTAFGELRTDLVAFFGAQILLVKLNCNFLPNTVRLWLTFHLANEVW